MTSGAAAEAVREAWRALGRSDEPAHVELVKRGRGATLVLRLHLAGCSAPVIAKRTTSGSPEVLVYERILSALPIETLRYHGSAVSADGGAWLFVDEARGAPYRPHLAAHRSAAARWLGALHRSTRNMATPPGLPRREPAYYRVLLEGIRRALRDRLGRRSSDSGEPFRLVLEHCDGMLARWGEFERACKGVPDTLVHGDIVDHNARVLGEGPGFGFVLFDWEKSGWGVCAEDVSLIERDVYLRALGEPPVDRAALDRLAEAGRIFRCLVYLDWALRGREPEDRTRAAERMETCRSWLDPLMARAAWAS